MVEGVDSKLGPSGGTKPGFRLRGPRGGFWTTSSISGGGGGGDVMASSSFFAAMVFSWRTA